MIDRVCSIMQGALDFQFNSVLTLLAGSSNEEKIAGVILANQFIAEPEVVEVSKKLTSIVRAATPSFVVRMLQTITLVDDTNLVQPAGANMLSLACQHKKVLLLFRGELPLLVYSMYACNDKQDIKCQIIATIKGLISIVNDDIVLGALRLLLSEYSGFMSVVNPLEVLELFVFMLDHIKQDSFTFSLSANESVLLRSLFVQVFHGAAPEHVRDKALSLCCAVLSKSHMLLPNWTTNSVKPLTGSEGVEPSLFPPNLSVNANFPVLLCSIIRGELHLVCEELVSLSTTTLNNPQSLDIAIGRSSSGSIKLAGDKKHSSVSKVTEGIQVEGEDDMFLSQDENSANNNKNNTATTTTNESTASTDRTIDDMDRRMLNRVTRLVSIHTTCMSLLDAILVMLLGNTKSDEQMNENGESNPDEISVWSRLPYDLLLDVKKIIDNTIKELFDFIKDSSNSLLTIVSVGLSSDGLKVGSDVRYVMSVTQVRDMVCRTVLTVSGYVAEDDGLVLAFVDYLPYVMRCSCMVPISVKTSSHSLNKETTTTTAAAEKSQHGMNFVTKICAAGDVLQYVLPIILSMLHALGSEDEDKLRLDRLYNTLDSVMGAAVHMLTALLSTISELLFHELAIAEDVKNGHNVTMKGIPGLVDIRLALSVGMNLSIVAMDLLQCVFEWKDTDIQTLLRSEGASAFHSIVFVEAEQMKRLYVTMKSGWTGIRDFTALLEQELEVLAVSDRKATNTRQTNQTEQSVIDLLCSVEQYQTSMRTVAKQLHTYSKLSEGK